jgi:hypothetical protein
MWFGGLKTMWFGGLKDHGRQGRAKKCRDRGEARDCRWIFMYDGGSPGKKRLRHRFCPTGFPVHCALVRVSRFTREGTEERNLTMFCLE